MSEDRNHAMQAIRDSMREAELEGEGRAAAKSISLGDDVDYRAMLAREWVKKNACGYTEADVYDACLESAARFNLTRDARIALCAGFNL